MTPISAATSAYQTTARHNADGRDRAAEAEKQREAKRSERVAADLSAREKKIAERTEARNREARALVPVETSGRGVTANASGTKVQLHDLTSLGKHSSRQSQSSIAFLNAMKGYGEALRIFGGDAQQGSRRPLPAA